MIKLTQWTRALATATLLACMACGGDGGGPSGSSSSKTCSHSFVCEGGGCACGDGPNKGSSCCDPDDCGSASNNCSSVCNVCD